MTSQDWDWPEFGLQADIRPALAHARATQRDCVIATLTALEGSAPRPLGTQMAFAGDIISGYLSGGCIEADIAHHAAATLVDDRPRDLVYGRGSPWLDIRLACGGRMELFLERVGYDDPAVEALLALNKDRRPAVWTSDGHRRRVSDAQSPKAATDVNARYAMLYQPRWRLMLVGGGPVALALGRLATEAGFEVVFIRPRGPIAGPAINGVRYVRDAIPEALDALGIDPWTAIVSLSHDDAIDDELALRALHGDAGYVGIMGAATRAEGRRQRLRAAGVADSALSKLVSPIGAVQTGKAPWEIAVSVMAQVMQTRSAAGGIATFLK